MYHNLPQDASFWKFLLSVDQDLAGKASRKGCGCGGRLHRADFPRKPRGASKLPEKYGSRYSFCCDRDGCRKRMTPPSVRFLGRKVYLGVIVILVAAMRHGPSPRRACVLAKEFGADRRTIARWQVFWQEHVPQTPFWKKKRGRLTPADRSDCLPQALLDAFVHNDDCHEDWERVLRFLSPLTTPGGLEITVS